MAKISFGVLLSVLFVVGGAANRNQTLRGLVIERVEAGSEAKKSGMVPGDVLVSWSRTGADGAVAAQGEFRTPFDARLSDLGQLPLGNLVVTYLHNGERRSARFAAGFLGAAVRPTFVDADLADYLAGKALEQSDAPAALIAWQPLIERLIARNDVETATWLLSRAAAAHFRDKQLDRAETIFDKAVTLAHERDAALEALVWEAKGDTLLPEMWMAVGGDKSRSAKLPEFLSGLDARRRCYELRAQLDKANLMTAASLIDFGEAEARHAFGMPGRDLASEEAKERVFQRSLAMQREAVTQFAELAPVSFAHARALTMLAEWVEADFAGLSKHSKEQASAASSALDHKARELFVAVESIHPAFLQVLTDLSSQAYEDTDAGRAADDIEQLERVRRNVAEQLGNVDKYWFATISLALQANKRGRLQQAVDLLEGLMPNASNAPPAAAQNARTNLWHYYTARGEVASAEALLYAAWQKDPKVATPNWLASLAGVDLKRGDTASADTLARRALEVFDRYARAVHKQAVAAWAKEKAELLPDRAAVRAQDTDLQWHRRSAINIYDLLAEIAVARGNESEARDFLHQAVDLEKHNTGVGEVNRRIMRHSRLASLNGDLVDAESGLASLLPAASSTSAGSVQEANLKHDIGVVRAKRRDYTGAEAMLHEALKVRETLQPSTSALAETLYWLARVARESDRPAEARGLFRRTLEVLDSQRTSLGGAASRTSFGTHNASFYSDFADFLIDRGEIAEALHVVERSRARTMLEMLAQRTPEPASTDQAELFSARRQLESEYDAAQAKIESLNPAKNPVEVTAALSRLRRIRLQLDDANAAIQKTRRGAVGATNPIPLSVDSVRAALDPGTALLSYFVGSDRTHIFVVTSSADSAGDDGLSVVTINITEQQLREHVSGFRTVIDWQADPKTADRALLLARSRALYDLLVKPVEAQIARSQRVLLSPSGPLQILPFAALVRQTSAGPQYLTEWKPLHTTMSATIYAQTRANRRTTSSPDRVVAFGDPVYPAEAATTNAEAAYFTRRGAGLKSLPATRREVNDIAALFGPRATTYLGADATEERAKTLDISAKYVHFAVHGVLNEYLPLNSALVLSLPNEVKPGQDNGLLQAWEIFEHVRLSADLVTLSACDTGLGKEIAGEGLIGLTRAFLYAGAHTVASTLWKVADGSTAELMKRFYRNLRDGQTKDQALRNAQIALIRLGRPPGSKVDYSNPVHWASFQLTGDWR